MTELTGQERLRRAVAVIVAVLDNDGEGANALILGTDPAELAMDLVKLHVALGPQLAGDESTFRAVLAEVLEQSVRHEGSKE